MQIWNKDRLLTDSIFDGFAPFHVTPSNRSLPFNRPPPSSVLPPHYHAAPSWHVTKSCSPLYKPAITLLSSPPLSFRRPPIRSPPVCCCCSLGMDKRRRTRRNEANSEVTSCIRIEGGRPIEAPQFASRKALSVRLQLGGSCSGQSPSVFLPLLCRKHHIDRIIGILGCSENPELVLRSFPWFRDWFAG